MPADEREQRAERAEERLLDAAERAEQRVVEHEQADLSLTIIAALRGAAHGLGEIGEQVVANSEKLVDTNDRMLQGLDDVGVTLAQVESLIKPARSWTIVGRIALAVTFVAAIAACVGVWLVMGQNGQLLAIAQTNRSNTEEIKRLTRTIESCTTPVGQCARDNAEATKAAIAQLSQTSAAYNLIASECDHAGDTPAVATCFLTKVKEQGLPLP